MEARFVVMDIDNMVDVLPVPVEWTVAPPLNDTSTLTLKYSSLASRGDLAARLLDQGYDVALQVRRGAQGSWLEPKGARFTITDDGSDPTHEDGMIEFTGIGVVAFDFSGVLGRNLATATYDVDAGRFVFTAATAGKVLRAYIDGNTEYHSVTPSFTATHDSAGQPWATQFARLELPPTDNLLSILQRLSDQGMLDWTSQGNTLHAYNPETALKIDNTDVELMFARECTDGPQKRSRRDYASDVIAVGENGKVYLRANPNPTVGRRGRRAVGASGSVTSEADATLAANSIFATSGGLIREQLTRALDFTNPKYLPFIDYNDGDMIMAPGRAGRSEELRVQQITLQGQGSEVVGGSVVLNDRFLEASVRAARRLARLEGGAGKPIGGSTPSVPEAGKRKPAAPTGGVATVEHYFNQAGRTTGLATFTWNPVTTDVDGVPIGIQRYEVRARRSF